MMCAKRLLTVLSSSCLCLALLSPMAFAETAPGSDSVMVTMRDREGKTVGTVRLQDTPHGVLMHADLSGLPKGPHAFHIHAVGKCEPPFDSAGPHFNPGNHHHGLANPEGSHAGDLPNVFIPDSGAAIVEVLASNVRLREGDGKLLDADGSSIVIHAKADDHQTDPAGAAGDRIACGVIAAQ